MKRLNLPLLVGGIIIGIIILIILFPQKLTHFNPYIIEGIKSAIQKNGSIAVQGAPFAPSRINIFGTDQLGRDELSLIIYGTRLTLEVGIMVVFGRFIIALPIGIAAGFGNFMCKSVINLFNILFSAIPALIISIIVLSISFFLGLYKEQSILAFVIVLTVVGFSKLAGLISERVENILSQPFITGERAIGKSDIKIAFENVLSHLASELIVLFFMEMALALSMIMKLGLFGVFVGNIRVVSDSTNTLQLMNISYEPEWASMLASSIFYLSTAPWTVLSPAITFFISIFGFNLFAEGLREELQSRNSTFVRFKLFTRKTVKTAGYILCIVIFIVAANGIFKNYKGLNEDEQASKIINWGFKSNVLPGSEEAKYTADNLKTSLEKAGFQSIGQDFIQKYKIDKLYSIEKSTFSINNEGSINELIWGRDFSFASNGNYLLNGGIFDAREVDIFNIKNYHQFDNKFILVDEQTYSRENIDMFEDKLQKESKILGIIDIIGSDDQLPPVINTESSGKVLIYMSKEASKYLKGSSKLAIDTKSYGLSEEGRNVIGILPGKNPNLSKEAIMIGMGYNYMAGDKENASERLKMMIETAKKLYDSKGKQGRSIILAFWDGNLTDQYSGVRYYASNPLYPLENTIVNIDLTGMNTKGDTFVINSQQAPIIRYSAWAFNHEFELNIKHSGINIEEYIDKKSISQILGKGPNSQEILYYKYGVPTILAIPKSHYIEGKQAAIEKNFVNVLVSSITNINY